MLELDPRRQFIKRVRKLSVEEVIAACDICKGNVTKTAEYLRVKPTVLRAFNHRHSRLMEAFGDWVHRNTDAVESNIVDMAIIEKDRWAMAQYMAAHARDRGYGNQIDVAASDPNVVVVVGIRPIILETGRKWDDEGVKLTLLNNPIKLGEKDNDDTLVVDDETGEPMVIEGDPAVDLTHEEEDPLEKLRKAAEDPEPDEEAA